MIVAEDDIPTKTKSFFFSSVGKKINLLHGACLIKKKNKSIEEING